MSLRIVIVGAGQVGYNLSKSLAKEDYSLTVVDNNENKCLKVKNAIDAKVVLGNGASQRTLQKIDMTDVDYFLALTSLDEINLIASKTAKSLGAKKVIARLRSTEFSHKNSILSPEDFLIDHVCHPEKAAHEEIEKLIRRTSAVEVVNFHNDKITLLGIKLENSSPLVGRSVSNVKLANPFINHQTAVIFRNDESFVPHSDTIYNKDDVVYFVTRTEDVELIQQLSGKPSFDVNNIMIVGAGKLGRLLSKSLEYDYNIRLIEKSKNKAEKYNASLSNTLMLVGNALDPELLESENIFEMDCFIAATEDEQTNIMSCLLAKDYGVKQVVVHISTTNYIKPIRRMGIDAIVSKNVSAVNEVFKFIHTDQQEIEISRFEDIDIDSIELNVMPNCKYLRRKYTINDIPDSICLGAVIRDSKVIIPNSQSKILENDKILVFLKPKYISKVENIFH
ncbi:MAG: Trk system potassium transporter TrkA [Candidatus Marinimicrobia bacterium]|nr:Trk system potassium transporter TrkA [Candidatus Neomarinimicrobiota bacterium]|tara:strand:+ start:28388 stop:29737 length:1350 start_codon:yes stop_codon:yes gene_type:complete